MTDIYGPAAAPRVTFRELANAARIGRARFIGNTIGALLLLAALALGYLLLFFVIGDNALLFRVVRPRPDTMFVLPSPGAGLVFGILALIVGLDLGIRRRHDRNRSGIDVIVWAELELGSLVLHLFAPSTVEGLVLDAVCGLLGLWLVVVLVFLPGTRGPNRYGDDPRTLMAHAG